MSGQKKPLKMKSGDSDFNRVNATVASGIKFLRFFKPAVLGNIVVEYL